MKDTVRERSETAVRQLLTQCGLPSDLSEIPVRSIRQAQRGAVPGMRVTHLSPGLRDTFLQQPITSDLLCLRAGSHQALPTHYLPRPTGSYDTIFIYCTAGRGWLELNHQTFVVERHHGILIPAHTPHIYGADPEDPWNVSWAHFQGGQAKTYESLLTQRQQSPMVQISQSQELIACFETLYQAMSRVHRYETMVAASGALSQLLGTAHLLTRASEVRSKSSEQSLKQTVEFMQQNLSRPITLHELAAIAGMNPNYYATLFSKQYGRPPIDFFNRLKIQHACEILSTTDLRISEVSDQLGFTDPYYFSRLFRKIMGIAPSQYS